MARRCLDVSLETIINLHNAAGYMRRRFHEKKRPHLATVYRWTTRGLQGIVLESVQIGGKRYTSLEAIQRFIERLSSSEKGERS